MEKVYEFLKKNPYPIAVFAVAVASRLIYMATQWDNPFRTYPISDSATYMLRAREILEGNFLGTEALSQSGEAFYTYYLALIIALFGKHYFPIRAIQLLLGAFSCLFIYLTANKLYGKNPALFAGIWAALYGPFIFHEWNLLTNAHAFFFLSASFYLLVLQIYSPSDKKAFFSGLLFGLAVLNRTNLLLLAPLYFLGAILKDPKKLILTKGPYLLTLGVLLTILPVTAKNYYLEDDFILISSTGGLAFYLGNNDQAIGYYKIPKNAGIPNTPDIHREAHKVAETSAGRELKPSEGSDFWLEKGRQFWRDEPGKALSLYRTKVNLFWNKLESNIIYEYSFFQDRSKALLKNPFTNFGAVALVGLIGALWALKSGRREDRFIVFLIVVYMATRLPFFITSRRRVPGFLFLFFLVDLDFFLFLFCLHSLKTSNH